MWTTTTFTSWRWKSNFIEQIFGKTTLKYWFILCVNGRPFFDFFFCLFRPPLFNFWGVLLAGFLFYLRCDDKNFVYKNVLSLKSLFVEFFTAQTHTRKSINVSPSRLKRSIVTVVAAQNSKFNWNEKRENVRVCVAICASIIHTHSYGVWRTGGSTTAKGKIDFP